MAESPSTSAPTPIVQFAEKLFDIYSGMLEKQFSEINEYSTIIISEDILPSEKIIKLRRQLIKNKMNDGDDMRVVNDFQKQVSSYGDADHSDVYDFLIPRLAKLSELSMKTTALRHTLAMLLASDKPIDEKLEKLEELMTIA